MTMISVVLRRMRNMFRSRSSRAPDKKLFPLDDSIFFMAMIPFCETKLRVTDDDGRVRVHRCAIINEGKKSMLFVTVTDDNEVAELNLTTGELRVLHQHGGISPMLDARKRTRHHFVDFGGRSEGVAVRVSVREEDRGVFCFRKKERRIVRIGI